MRNKAAKNHTLVWAREHLGLTQQELADLLGVSRSMIVRWENGKPLSPGRTSNILEKLSIREADIPEFARPDYSDPVDARPKTTPAEEKPKAQTIPAGEKPKATNASAAPTAQTAKETWADFDNDYLEDTALFATKQALAFREFMKDEAVVNAEEVVGIMVNYMPVDDTTLKQAVAIVTKALNRLTIAGKLERIKVPYPGSTETATVWRLPGDLV